jgi:hypothetical protein
VAIDLAASANIGNQSDFLRTDFSALKRFLVDPSGGLPEALN